MNAYFDKNQVANSNSRIFNAYYGTQAKSTSGLIDRARKLQKALRAMANSRTLRIAKAVTFSVVLVAFLGIVGAMDRGTLGMGAGLALCTFLLGVEALCLCPHRA